MTGPRHEREGAARGAREPAPYASYGAHERHAAHDAYGAHGSHAAHGGPEAFAAAVEGPGDSLTGPSADSLPDSVPSGPTGRTTGTASLSVPPPTGRRRRARPAST
ncbi:class E sortase, partial [Streptomyces sp. SID8382]|nr:class E sortase [Streptomyces sp. SID8382]